MTCRFAPKRSASRSRKRASSTVACHLNLRAGDQKNPDYLRLNPNGYVPTLVHDDFVVCELTVICEYLDDAFPCAALKPADARGRARMRGFTKFIDAAIFAHRGGLDVDRLPPSICA